MKYLAIIFVLLFSAPAFAGPDDFAAGVAVGRKIAELEQRIEKLEKRIKELEASGCTTPASEPKKIEPPAKIEVPEHEEPAAPSLPQDVPVQSRFGTVEGVVTEHGLDAFVFLDRVPGQLVRDKSVSIQQANRQFSPRFLVVQKGTTLEFPNRDAIYHNVFSLSPGNKFDVGYTRSGEIAAAQRLTTPGTVDIYCNTHAQMSALVVVTPNEHFIRIDKKSGKFSLPKIPAGRRTFVFVASDGRRSEATINVLPDVVNTLAFELPLAQNARPHLDKRGQPYRYQN